MLFKRSLFLPLFLSLILNLHCSEKDVAESDALYEGFLHPEREYRPRVWWHWMNGNITPDGIRKDLEWMDRAGIVGFHNFDANMSTPLVVDHRLVYMTPEWKEAFNGMLDIADSLDMEVSIASSPGWSITGGPWVTEDDAQKKLVWREWTVHGGRAIKDTLPAPITNCGPYQDILLYPDSPERYAFYRDLCVLAVRLTDSGAGDDETGCVISTSDPSFDCSKLTDGCLSDVSRLVPDEGGNAWIEFRFEKPVNRQSLHFVEFTGTPVCLEADLSGNGLFETLVEAVPMARVSTTTVRTYDFPQTEAFAFRIRSLAPGVSLKPVEASLSRTPVVNLVEDKAGFLPNYLIYDNYPTPDYSGMPKISDVIDLTGMVKDGVLSWQVPEGDWKLFRFGFNLQGKRNAPASPEATGLEVDKLDAEAVKRYYQNYLGMYQEASGGRLGSAIHCLMIDSYESGRGNWTLNMEREFKERRGYDLRPWLPVLTGQILETSAKSEQFLFDWRTTLGELIAENHYDIVNDILAEYGMTRYTESHEWRKAFVGDGMMPKRKADVPMAAMWIHSTDEGRHSSYPSGDADIRESSSVAHIYGQNICAAESFTVDGRIGERNGLGAYQSSPSNLKPLADAMLAEGLNRFVIHTSVHQPVDDRVPGLGLGPYGQWFNRHDTWAEEARTWTDYLSRNCFMMQQGRWVADIAWFYGEDKNVTGMYIKERIPVPQGYNFDLVNADILLNKLKIKGHCLVTDTGMHYRALVLDPDLKYISLPVLKRIRSIKRAGIPVLGPCPLAKANLKGDDRRFRKIADDIWDGRNAPVTDKTSLQEALLRAEIEKDVDLDCADGADVRYVHRKLDQGDLYWIANITPEYRNMTVSFRIDGMKPEIWHPDTGKKEEASYHIHDGRTWLDLHFTPDDAQYILFRDPAEKQEQVVPDMTEHQVLNLNGPWEVSFQAKYDAPAPIMMPVLRSLSDYTAEDIRYFSSTATYRCSFEAGEDVVSGDPLYLDLGEVHHMARVKLNGEDLGLAWKTPYRVEVTGKIQPGANHLEVLVTNSWANRLIGDERKTVTERVTYTPEQFYTKTDEPIPSGLVGPVIILTL